MPAPDISQWFPKLNDYGSFKNQPENLNLASSTNFRFIADKVPETTYFCTSAILPTLSSKPRVYDYMFGANPKFPGGRTVKNFSVRFIISEDFKNYMQMVNWLKSGIPYRNFEGVTSGSSLERQPWKSQPCDGKIFLLNNKKNPIKIVTFSFLIPKAVSGFTLTHGEADPTVLTATVDFEFDSYDVVDVKTDEDLSPDLNLS